MRIRLVVKKYSQASEVRAGKGTSAVVMMSAPVVRLDTGVMTAIGLWPVCVAPLFVAMFVVDSATVSVAMRLVIDNVMVVAAVVSFVFMFATILLVMATPAMVDIISVHHQRCTRQSQR